MDRRTFILNAKAFGSAATPTALGTAYDTAISQMPADSSPAPDPAAIVQSNRVSAWLASLRVGTPVQRAQFETLRVRPYAEQRSAWLAAGSPVV